MTPARKKAKQRPRRRGSITLTEQGTYLARVRLPRDPVSGQRRGSSLTLPTKVEAERWLADELERLDRGEVVGASGKGETLEAFLRDFYANVRQRTDGRGMIAARTCAVDLVLLDTYVFRRAPQLSATTLRNLNSSQFAELFTRLAEGETVAGVVYRPLARATVSRVARTLAARLAYAVEAGKLRFNPAVGRGVVVRGKEKRKRRILTNTQAAALLAVCAESKIGAFVSTLLWTGCRPGEACGATWDDFDLDARTFHIRRSLVRVPPSKAAKGAGTSWTLGPTKTGTQRVVPLPDALVAVLRRHRAEQAELKLKAGSEYENHGLVFCTPFGRPLFLDTLVERDFRPLLRRAALHLAGETPLPVPVPSKSPAYKAAVAARRAQEEAAIAKTGFPMISLYECRHLFGSRLSASGAPIKDIADLMGHRSTQTTLYSYVHTDETTQRNALSKLEDAFTPKGRRHGAA